MNECIFCKIVKVEAPCYKIYEDEKFLAFLDINPISPGHLIIIPKQHEGYVFNLDDDLYNGLFIVARKLSRPLQRAVQSKRIGMAIEGFGVDHVHLHLVPLNQINELDPNRAKPGAKEELGELAGLIKDELQNA